MAPTENLAQRVRSLVDERHDHVVSIRRAIHRRPELAFEEVETAARVVQELEAVPVDRIRKNVARTGVVAEIDGHAPGKLVVLRADIDALPINEENTFDFASEIAGKMHACGHDGHTAALLGAARVLSSLREEFEGTVRLLFQPSEEKLPGGAPEMIAGGALAGNEAGPPLGIFGQHVRPGIPAGRLGVLPGPFMASADEIYVTIHADGGHAAEPHLQNADPVFVAAQTIVGMQAVISRMRPPGEPGVLTIGRVIADGATNVIPKTVAMEGTLRAMSEAWREKAHGQIRQIVMQTAAAFGASADVEIRLGYPALVNDDDAAALVERIAVEYVGAANVVELDRWYAAEDFAYYLQQAPGAFYMLGTGNIERGIASPVHTPTFTIDEEALRTGTGFLAYLAIRRLQEAAGRTVEVDQSK